MEKIKCKTCDKEIDKIVWNKKECDECAKTYHKRYNKRTYIPTTHTKKCLSCSKVFFTKSNKKVYCDFCAEERNKLSKKKYHIKQKIDNPQLYLWRKSKMRAKQKNIKFNIDIEDIIIPNVCPVLDIELEQSIGKNVKLCSPSLDRIDANKGYVKGNVAVISWKANMIKNIGTIEEHLKIAKWMKEVLNE